MCVSCPSPYNGLKQASRAWFNRFAEFAVSIGFTPTQFNTSLFVCRNGAYVTYLLLYVDNMILTASSSALLRSIITKLQSKFAIKDMGAIRLFLGVAIQ
jgi:hypothetical protein